MASSLTLRSVERLSDLDRGAWNELVADESPFLEWDWLASLEEAGCVAPETGWLPKHLGLFDGVRLVGACPLYLKSHSMGEFVFDQGWAEAAEAAGIRYYPKVLCGIPFTPATGARFLSAPDFDRATVVRSLAAAAVEICRVNQLSSVHVNFCTAAEADLLERNGFEARAGLQFQWLNRGWTSFEEYVGALRSKRRNQVRRERRALGEQGIEIEALVGSEIPDELFGTIYRLYRSTVDKFYWGRPYLNAELFDLLRDRWRERLCVILARRDGRVIAGTVNVLKGSVLYGRYWGAFEEVRHLHFNVCYYAPIELCLERGIERFEPGAGGEFKQIRGFDARPTTSLHHLADPRLSRAVAEFLARERDAVDRTIDFYGERTAYRRG